MRKNDVTKDCRHLHDIVDCKPPSADVAEDYDTDQDTMLRGMAKLNSDLKTAVQTCLDLRDDKEARYRAFTNIDPEMVSLIPLLDKRYDMLYRDRSIQFYQESSWAASNLHSSSSENIEETIKTLSSKFAFDGSFLEKDDPIVDTAYFLTVGNIKTSLTGAQQIKVIEHFEKANLVLPLSKFGVAANLLFGDNQ